MDRSPATPPGMRVRTGRFEKLRSRETGQSQSIRPVQGQDGVEEHAAIAPPATAIGRHLSRNVSPGTQHQQFPVHGRTAFPVFELDGAQPMTQPLVKLSPDLWCLRQPEVRLPSPNIGPQTIRHILYAAPTTAAGQLPDAPL